jgi:TBC1 domain family member 20
MEMNGNAVEHIKHESDGDTECGKHSLDAGMLAKTANILEACRWKDVERLQALAASDGGLLSDDLRRQAC